MPSRQDQLHSYQFSVQRVVSALVLRETDPPQSPFRRVATAALASVLVAVVIAAGFGVYGVFTNKGDRSWNTEGAVIIEKGTGAVFVFRDNKLHPALNLASALLASSSPKPPRFEVSAKSLQGVAWGPTVGVPFLPDSLPDPGTLVGLPWSVCSVSVDNKPTSVVSLGGQAGSAGRPVPSDEAIMVRAAGNTTSAADTYMLWRGRLYEAKGSLASLVAPSVQPTPVPLAFLKGVTKGQPLEPPAIGAMGKPWARNIAWKVGDVLTVSGFSDDRYVVVREQGLAWVTQFQAALLGTGKPGSEKLSDLNQYGTIESDLLPKTTLPQDPPVSLPKIETYTGSGLCAVIKDEAGESELRADVRLDLSKRPGTATRSTDGAVYADYVIVPNGRGAIVVSGQTYSLVAQDGVRYAAANIAVLTKLGYEGKSPVRLPSSLISLLPEGPGLDPHEALVPLTVS
jgi:type VII secretion protein EccB